MSEKAPSRVFDFYPLEDRILLSGEGIQGAEIALDVDVSASLMAELAEAEGQVNDNPAVTTALVTPAVGNEKPEIASDDFADLPTLDPSLPLEVVFVDSAVEDVGTLLDGLRASGQDQTQWLVVELSADQDGIAQITRSLANLSGVDAIHIVSHGDGQGLQLGNTRLDVDAAASYAGEIASWAGSLDISADLLIYGCDLASTSDGRELIDSIALLCDCDVAASTDGTGHAKFGADWDLEYTAGVIETDVAFGSESQQSWSGLLAVMNVTQTADVVNGNVTSVANLIASDGGDGISLREAILATNADSGITDTINLAAGTYTLTGASGDDGAVSGDLDISDDLVILGAGTGMTIIDGGGNGLAVGTTDRVFHILAGVVSMSDLRITGGDTAGGGGGLRVEGGGNVTLTDVTVDGNAAANGGGLRSDGIVTLTGVTISNNDSSGHAGGIRTSGDMTLTNVTISGNTASGNGGGLWNNNLATLQNVTITDNSAATGAGIHDTGGAATTNIRNTIVAGNLGSADVQGLYNSLGNNLIGNTGSSSGWVGSDLQNISPTLGALADNGGATQTHALLAGSRGIDEGTNAGAPPDDQRGTSRDATADIGAYESVATANPISPTITSSSTSSLFENQTAVQSVTTTDPDGGDLTISLSYRTDQAKVTTGAPAFITDPASQSSPSGWTQVRETFPGNHDSQGTIADLQSESMVTAAYFQGLFSSGSSIQFDSPRYTAQLEMLERLLQLDIEQSIVWQLWDETRELAEESPISFFTASICTAIGLFSGYVLWGLRGGAFLTAIGAGLPAWRIADPTAILAAYRGSRTAAQDRVEKLLTK